MPVSSNLSHQRSTHVSKLHESCVVSVTLPCFTTIFLSKDDFIAVGGPSSELDIVIFDVWQFNA